MKALTLLLTFWSVTACAQSDSAEVIKTINRFFDGMRTADSLTINGTLAPNAVLQTIIQKEGTPSSVETEDLNDFIKAVTTPHPEVYDERIVFETIKIDGALASVWTPYKFFVGSKFSHCGVNSFQLVKLAGIWKIQYIIDTRRKANCP